MVLNRSELSRLYPTLLAKVERCLAAVAQRIYCPGLVADWRDRRMDFPNRRKPQMFPLDLQWRKSDAIVYSDLCWVW